MASLFGFGFNRKTSETSGEEIDAAQKQREAPDKKAAAALKEAAEQLLADSMANEPVTEHRP